MTTAVISAFFVYAVCLWNRKPYLAHMSCLESAINKSKKASYKLLVLCLQNVIIIYFPGLNFPRSKSIYITYNGYVELFCKLVYVGLVKIAPLGSMTPLAIISYVSYYFLDLGEGAFILPFPMW